MQWTQAQHQGRIAWGEGEGEKEKEKRERDKKNGQKGTNEIVNLFTNFCRELDPRRSAEENVTAMSLTYWCTMLSLIMLVHFTEWSEKTKQNKTTLQDTVWLGRWSTTCLVSAPSDGTWTWSGLGWEQLNVNSLRSSPAFLGSWPLTSHLQWCHCSQMKLRCRDYVDSGGGVGGWGGWVGFKKKARLGFEQSEVSAFDPDPSRTSHSAQTNERDCRLSSFFPSSHAPQSEHPPRLLSRLSECQA